MLLGLHTCSRLYLPAAKCRCGREDAASIRPEKMICVMKILFVGSTRYSNEKEVSIEMGA
jgi:hypothetical protein